MPLGHHHGLRQTLHTRLGQKPKIKRQSKMLKMNRRSYPHQGMHHKQREVSRVGHSILFHIWSSDGSFRPVHGDERTLVDRRGSSWRSEVGIHQDDRRFSWARRDGGWNDGRCDDLCRRTGGRFLSPLRRSLVGLLALQANGSSRHLSRLGHLLQTVLIELHRIDTSEPQRHKGQKDKHRHNKVILMHGRKNPRFLLVLCKALTKELGTGPREKVARKSGSMKMLYLRSSISRILQILSCQAEVNNGRSKAAKHKKTSHTQKQ